MGISSLGVGSGILTQDLLDKLRKADESGQLTPVKLSIANEKDKQSALEVLDANMKNFTDSINELKSGTLYDERSATVSGSKSVAITASANSDIQDFTMSVNTLATKQIEESGAFDLSVAGNDSIGATDGTFKLEVGSQSVNIDYSAGTTLDQMKKLIQEQANSLVDATVLQISPTESRLVLSSKATGASQDIKISDVSGTLDTKLTSDSSFKADGTGNAPVQTALDSSFDFNGQTITRSSNTVDDLITGYSIELLKVDAVDASSGVKESSAVSVAQNRDNIISRVDSFVEKYNAAITELGKLTKSSSGSDKGIFSNESIVKGLKSSIENIIGSVGGGAGTLYDYGFDVDKDGVMSIDKTIFNKKLDENPANVEAFFSGGTFTKPDSTTVELTGAFTDMGTEIESYTKYNAMLDQLNTSITTQISSFEDREKSVTDRLDSKYAILKKKYASYDALINKFNASSSIFTQLANQRSSN